MGKYILATVTRLSINHGQRHIYVAHSDMKQIISIHDTAHLHKFLQEKKKTIVLTGGCFDILHIGHISLFEHAKKQGDTLIVLLESDSSIAKQKGRERPIHSQLQRATVLSAIKYIDYIVMLPSTMTNESYDILVKALQPDIIATTESDPGVLHKKRQAKLIHARLVFVNKVIPNISTSRIASAIEKEL